MKNNVCRFCGGKTKLKFKSNKPNASVSFNDYTCTSSSFGLHKDIVQCSKCQIIYVDETITQEQVGTYYEIASDSTYFNEQEARRITFLKYLHKLPLKGKLLDIGTNTGLFIKIALDNGWDATGLEPNKWSVEYAKKNYGINLINKLYTPKIFHKNYFEVITMWDVIEHFVDPITQIKTTYDYLKPGGVFAFSTVDPDSTLAKIMGTRWSWYMEMHKVFFSRKCAEIYLRNAGFKKIIFTSHWRYLSLGYFASRLGALSPVFSTITSKIVSFLKIENVIVPYYANDLYNCYAFK